MVAVQDNAHWIVTIPKYERKTEIYMAFDS
jgi:hypothetical protein